MWCSHHGMEGRLRHIYFPSCHRLWQSETLPGTCTYLTSIRPRAELLLLTPARSLPPHWAAARVALLHLKVGLAIKHPQPTNTSPPHIAFSEGQSVSQRLFTKRPRTHSWWYSWDQNSEPQSSATDHRMLFPSFGH